MNDFYKRLADQEPCVGIPEPPPPPGAGNWEKLTKPGPKQTDTDLADAWAMYIDAVGATLPTPAGWFALLAVKPSVDQLMKAYGIP